MKYIIDIPKTVGMTEKVGGVHYTYFDGIQCQTIILKNDEIEELNSDYINEHYSSLQDEAYQCGLNDAWEAARKIIHMPEGELLNIFTECYSAVCTALQAILKYDASEAIEKLKAYEEKQNDKIEVGDEVEHSVECFVVTVANDKYVYGISKDGTWCYASVKNVHKTGRHFDIASILEEMKE